MNTTLKMREVGLKLVMTVIFTALAVIMITPFLWMISSSFKLPADMFKYPIDWIPERFVLDNYKEVWFGKYPFLLYYWNSIKITALTVGGCLITSALAGFAFAKLRFKGRDLLFVLYLATMIIPSQILLVPRFILFDKLGMLNTHMSLILPGMFTVLAHSSCANFSARCPMNCWSCEGGRRRLLAYVLANFAAADQTRSGDPADPYVHLALERVRESAYFS